MTHSRRRLLSYLAAGAFLVIAPQAFSQDLQRGLRNYRDIVSGKKKLEQLSPQERREVLLVARRMRSANRTGKSRECRDALARAEEAGSELASSARRLANCAESEDYEDDCSSEFSSARSDHDDYEDAVSDVQSHCN